MAICVICLTDTKVEAQYHTACLKVLFGTKQLPRLDIELRDLYAIAAKMAGKMSFSGVQEKVSIALSPDRTNLEVAPSGGRYILKPENTQFACIPQNEHVTMRLAGMLGIELPPLGLLYLRDGTIAYIIKRFDRLDDGTKLLMEDFCQLSGTRLRDKYRGTSELCVRLLHQYATEPLIQVRNFFQLLLFGWWVGNGDMHLKNFSLLTTADGVRKLTPAHDLVCTRLALPNDIRMAMKMGGKDKGLTRQSWLDFAAYCGIPDRAAARLVRQQMDALQPACELIQRSFLPDEMKSAYQTLVKLNSETLGR